MKHTRENSMSIFKAIEDIQTRTAKRQDTCAREFAKALMDSYPDLMFWQNIPPDLKDLPKEKVDLVLEVERQVWPCPIKTSGHMIGPWLLDVYAGSRKTTQFGNKWNEPYPFNYRAKFEGERVPPEVDGLPQPLMRDFRANKDAMRELCNQARAVLKPGKKKTEHVSTEYVLQAALQVAEAVNADRGMDAVDANIDEKLERFDDENPYPDVPIHSIRFFRQDDNIDPTRIEITYELGSEIKSAIRKKRTFVRMIRKCLREFPGSRQSHTNY